MKIKILQKKIPAYLVLGMILLIAFVLIEPVRSFAQDSTGGKTGTITDVTAAKPGAPTAAELGTPLVTTKSPSTLCGRLLLVSW
ncbi:hypothetical protein DIU38_024305 [Mucilaginibacter sp. P4]|uniref:hypothetical protein n=1 Tax=Mucilaginibacter sp. P4 TaxID=3383180 RepID=UPI0011EBB661|nr:hypothetical protein [Mucilaginibacter gossypii]QEM19024.1 hypothetical protein DIU38_024305 [Mucilaginibacter gossypii]